MDSPYGPEALQTEHQRATVSEPGAAAALAALWALPVARHAQPGSLEILGRSVQLVRLPKAHTIFRRGDLPGGLYFIVSGSVKLLAQAPAGRHKVIDIFADGQMFGEIGLFMDGPYRSWAQTIGRCALLYLPRHAVIESIAGDLGLMQHFLREVSSRSGGTERQRVVLPATKSAVASLLCLSPEVLSRVLRRFHDDGLIEANGRAVRLIDQRRLRACLES